MHLIFRREAALAGSRYGVSEAKFEKWLKQGRGQGRGADYRPWLTIEDVPSLGLTSRVPSATAGRMHTLFSKIELGVFMEADWSPDVFDIREQFPLPRPDTIAIAETMGVAHPRVGSVDVVMTTDLLLDVAATSAAPKGLVAVACKPSSDLDDQRVMQKLEIERRFWSERGVPYRIVTEREVCEARILNLTVLADRRTLDEGAEPRPGYWRDVCGIVLETFPCGGDRTLAEALGGLEKVHGWSCGDGLSALLHLAAIRVLPIDVDRGFEPRGPASQVRAPTRLADVAGLVAA